MYKNRILSLCCCIPMLATATVTLSVNEEDLKAPFVAEIITQQSIDTSKFKNRRELVDELRQQYLEEQAELERQRIEREKEEAGLAAIAEEERLEKERQEKLRQERLIQQNRIYCTFEVSFYTTAPDEGGGDGRGASGEYVKPWVSIALPRKTLDGRKIPFYSTATIEGLGTFINHDTGSYITWTNDNICRVDICVSSKQEAYKLGRFLAKGYIDLKR